MKRLVAIFSIAALAVLPTHAAQRPNVVMILADDLGWSDTTLFGTTSLYQTPNVERLARRGMTFTRAYSDSPLCSPTRSAIMTGLSPARTGITTPSCHLPQVVLEATPGAKGPANCKSTIPSTVTRLKTEYHTLAEALKDAGYATGHFGKWHLGHEPYSPLEHGFDVDVPHWPGPGPAGSYVAPWKFPDFDPDTPDEHIEDRMAREAVAFLEQHKTGPFYLNYWMFSVHAPFDAKRDLIEKYRSLVNPQDAQRSPTYAAMVESMDDAVGTLLDTLDRLGIADNTIILFSSDNGGNMYNEVDGTTPTSNRPLRGGKATMYEGGTRVPTIVCWPGHVTGGTRNDTLIQSSDFYPTLLEMLGLAPQPGQRFDGMSFVPALQGKPLARDAIFTYFPHLTRVPDWLPPAVAVHQGDWKLIRIFFGGENGAHRWKLYNLKDDAGEMNDLSAREPERVAAMDALIERFLNETHAVQPLPNPAFDPAAYHPEDEGKATPRSTHKDNQAPAKKVTGKPVAGWIGAGGATLTLNQGALVIHSTGRDPQASQVLTEALPAGRYEMDLMLNSQAGGKGQLFWQEAGVTPAFFRDRSTVFEVTHDGKPHTYRVGFEAAHPVLSLRLDPAQAAGEIRVLAMRLRDGDGALVREWSFGEK